MRNRPKFLCQCGHTEETHNFDPDSSMFGCLYIMINLQRVRSGIHKTTVCCPCREFRADNLRYLEQLSQANG